MRKIERICAMGLMMTLAWKAGVPGQRAQAAAGAAAAMATEVERLDPAIDAIVPKDAAWTTLASGYKWTEGPVWIKKGGYLLFAEIPSNSIRKVTPGSPASIWLQPSGYKGSDPYGPEPGTNGMTLDRQGRLTVAGHAARSIQRFESMDPHGTVTILADSYQGKKLNSPNDVIYAKDGSIYFTDPPYGLRTERDSDPEKELPFCGVYRVANASSQKPGSAPDHKAIQLLIKELPRPNGLALSPDGKWLYVANTIPKKWMKYAVKADGSLGESAVFFDASTDKRIGSPDGMKVDEKGFLYSAGPAGIWIFSPDGKHIGTIHTPASTGNLTWGGADGKTLFITSSDGVYSMRLLRKGMLP